MTNCSKWYAAIHTLIIICDGNSSTCVPSPRHKPAQLNCGKDTIRIPAAANFNFTIQMLNLIGCSNLQFHNDDWKGYENLTELIIRSVVLSSQKRNIPLDKFSQLNLEKLALTNCGLDDYDMWTLPTTLHEYNVSNNRYTYLNVSMCPGIRVIDASENQLIKLPMLSNPPPPFLTQFHLLDNPLNELTVEQLAPHCNLYIFDWRSPLNTTNSICQCLRLQKWSTLFELRMMEVQCDKLPQQMDCDLTFSPIKHLRGDCLDINRIPDGVIVPPAFGPFSLQNLTSDILQEPSEWQTPFAYIIAIVSALLGMVTVSYVGMQFYKIHADVVEERTTDLDETESVAEEGPV